MQIQAAEAPSRVVQGTGNTFGISLIAALAGFIFGFDTVVISGANQPIKDTWHTTAISPWFHGLFIMSMALWGTVVGAIFGGEAALDAADQGAGLVEIGRREKG